MIYTAIIFLSFTSIASASFLECGCTTIPPPPPCLIPPPCPSACGPVAPISSCVQGGYTPQQVAPVLQFQPQPQNYYQDGQSSIVNFDSSFNGFGQQQQQQQIIVQQPQPQSHQAVYPESAPIIQPIHPPAAPPTPIEVDSNRALHQETKFPDDNRPKNSTQHEAGSGTHSNKTSSSSVRRAQARGVVVSSATTAIADNDDDEDDTTTITTTESLTTSTTATSTDSRCNNESLRMIIIDNIVDTASESKRAINRAAEEKFGLSIDVICSQGHFSYVFNSNLYCDGQKNNVSCIAFRQA